MPQFEHDDLALRHREFGEAPHRRPFGRGFVGRFFKPTQRFPFACQPPPQRTTIIQRAISIAPHAIIFGFRRRAFHLHQRDERFLHDIFRLAVAEAERAAIQN